MLSREPKINIVTPPDFQVSIVFFLDAGFSEGAIRCLLHSHRRGVQRSVLLAMLFSLLLSFSLQKKLLARSCEWLPNWFSASPAHSGQLDKRKQPAIFPAIANAVPGIVGSPSVGGAGETHGKEPPPIRTALAVAGMSRPSPLGCGRQGEAHPFART